MQNTRRSHHPVLSAEEGGVGWELEEESLKEGLVQPQLGGRLTLDDGSQLLVVPDQHHLLGPRGDDGNHALGLRAHGALVYDQLKDRKQALPFIIREMFFFLLSVGFLCRFLAFSRTMNNYALFGNLLYMLDLCKL